jgi:hypothetical protein
MDRIAAILGTFPPFGHNEVVNVIRMDELMACLPNHHSISMAQAMDTPPPPQRVAKPRVLPRRFMA